MWANDWNSLLTSGERDALEHDVLPGFIWTAVVRRQVARPARGAARRRHSGSSSDGFIAALAIVAASVGQQTGPAISFR